MRKALVVGVDYYSVFDALRGCVNDSIAVKGKLERHANGEVNFSIRHMTATDADKPLDRRSLRSEIVELFQGKGEVALFYFAGHGDIDSTGGFICSSECQEGPDGVSLSDIMKLANQSKFDNRIIILDSCYGGVAGSSAVKQSVAEIEEGVTILTASTADQYATEENGAGIFTTLLVEALGGAACNLVGDVTPGSIYAHIDQSLGPWGSRPVFKTNVNRFASLRRVKPPIELAELRRIAELFPSEGHQIQLDPTFEPERPDTHPPTEVPPPDPKNTAIFDILQRYHRTGLLVPDAKHMYHAAMESKSVRLTPLGKHYRRLASKDLI